MKVELHYCIFAQKPPNLHFLGVLKPSPFSKILVMCQTQATASDLKIYNIFAPRKFPLSKLFDGVIACDLWVVPTPPQTKNLAATLGLSQNLLRPTSLKLNFGPKMLRFRKVTLENLKIGKIHVILAT